MSCRRLAADSSSLRYDSPTIGRQMIFALEQPTLFGEPLHARLSIDARDDSAAFAVYGAQYGLTSWNMGRVLRPAHK